MSYILVIWSIVGVTSYPSYSIKQDWRAIGEFSNQTLCHDAARELALKSDRYRCVRSK